MKTTFATFKRVLSILWQLPQDMVGVLVYDYLKLKDPLLYDEEDADGIRVVASQHFRGGMSVGHFIFLSEIQYKHSKTAYKHEKGHCKQSEYLGWLYLLVIGLPSIIWATIHTYSKRIADKYDYYSFYTEKWANKLGGVA